MILECGIIPGFKTNEDNMKIVITIKEALEKFDFDKFCDLAGLNPYCMNEGLASGDEEITLTEEQARKLGCIN